MKKILITGITGFVGSHMADYLLTKKNIKVYGLKRWSSRMRNIHHLTGKITLIDGDITDYNSVKETLEKSKPDYIIHLAAQSFVSPSWNMPFTCMHTNVIGTLNFLEAMRHLKMFNTRFHVAGSGEEYGLITKDQIPITEKTELKPLNPYAVSKVCQDLLCYEHFMSYGIKTIRTRTFNHIGPRRDKVFAFGSFAYQIARIEQGFQKPVIKVGTLTAKRNWTDVRDMVKAYWLAITKCKPGELYLIGSENIFTVQEGLNMLLNLSTKKNIKIKEEKSRVRLTEVPLLIGNYKKFHALTGWKSKIPPKKTMQDILNYWREFVKNKN